MAIRAVLLTHRAAVRAAVALACKALPLSVHPPASLTAVHTVTRMAVPDTVLHKVTHIVLHTVSTVVQTTAAVSTAMHTATRTNPWQRRVSTVVHTVTRISLCTTLTVAVATAWHTVAPAVTALLAVITV